MPDSFSASGRFEQQQQCLSQRTVMLRVKDGESQRGKDIMLSIDMDKLRKLQKDKRERRSKSRGSTGKRPLTSTSSHVTLIPLKSTEASSQRLVLKQSVKQQQPKNHNFNLEVS